MNGWIGEIMGTRKGGEEKKSQRLRYKSQGLTSSLLLYGYKYATTKLELRSVIKPHDFLTYDALDNTHRRQTYKSKGH